MRNPISKPTKEQLKAILNKNINDCSENDIRFIFDVFNFTLKDFAKSGDSVDFEIHFKRTYLMQVIAKGGMLRFRNEYVNFQADDDCTNGISMGLPNTILEVVMVFIDMFMPNILKNAGYNISYDPDTSIFDSMEEAQEYMELIQTEGKKLYGSN